MNEISYCNVKTLLRGQICLLFLICILFSDLWGTLVSYLHSWKSQVYPDKYIRYSELLNCFQNGPFFKWSLSSLIHALSSTEPLNKNLGQNAFEKG